VGQGATASIVAANLLGEKYVSLQPGNRNAPMPSGSTLPESATTLPTDLDQIINVLDTPTRADLAVLLDEAGLAVAGRESDVSAILRQFPLSLTAATKLLTTMVQDNHTLGDLVANTNGFITRVNAQSGDLKRVISAGAGAVTTLALKAQQLQQTLVGFPGVERTFTNTFVEGRNAIAPLVPATRQLITIAPELDTLLRAVGPFTRAAVPTLNRAAAVSPVLETLANKATPIVAQAVPTLASLQQVAALAQPLSAWLGLSSQDLFNIFAGWDRAIQFRDGLSHIFNGDVYLSPGVVLNAANTGASPAARRQNLLDIVNPDILKTLGLVKAAARARAAQARTGVPATQPATGRKGGELGGLLSSLLPTAAPASPTAPSTAASSATTTATTTTTTTTTTSAAAAPPAAGSPSSGSSGAQGAPLLQHLLSFLLGK
jgi:ABC-type transporter Mla subunit MlaD